MSSCWVQATSPAAATKAFAAAVATQWIKGGHYMTGDMCLAAIREDRCQCTVVLASHYIDIPHDRNTTSMSASAMSC